MIVNVNIGSCRSAINRSVNIFSVFRNHFSDLLLKNKIKDQVSREGLSDIVHQQISGRKRFYKVVNVEERNPLLYSITLDGKELKTPARRKLQLPNQNLAMMVALEWDAQMDNRRGIETSSMPLMKIVSTAIDQVMIDKSSTVATCLSYLATDTILFQAHPEERALRRQQQMNFQPILRWLKDTFSLQLKSTEQINGKIPHNSSVSERLSIIIDNLDPFSLTCLQCATMECKSVFLALALIFGRITANQAVVAARLEEEYQIEIWGVVEGGHDMDRLNLAVGLHSVDVVMRTLWSRQALTKELDRIKILLSSV